MKSYFSHSEVLLLTILRLSERGSCLPRKLVAPRLNMETQTLAELMNWEAESWTEPLLTATLISEEFGHPPRNTSQLPLGMAVPHAEY